MAPALFIKARYPHLDVTALDINERAVYYTKRNADINNLYVRVIKSDLYSEVEADIWRYCIQSSLAAGKAVTFRLIQEAVRHLFPGGALQIVAYHNKGASR